MSAVGVRCEVIVTAGHEGAVARVRQNAGPEDVVLDRASSAAVRSDSVEHVLEGTTR